MIKLTFIAMALLSAHSALGAEVCKDYDGSIVYESSTTVGKSSVVIINPRLKVAGKEAFIYGGSSIGQRELTGTAFCRAMGMNRGLVSDVLAASLDTMIAVFRGDGRLSGVGQQYGNKFIKTVTCQK